MLGKEHALLILIFCVVILRLALVPAPQMPFFFTALFFTGVIFSPDADLSIPLTKHRGIMHTIFFGIVIAISTFIILYLVSSNVQGLEYLKDVALITAIGAFGGWMIHLLGDKISDAVKPQKLIWIGLVAILLVVGFYGYNGWLTM